MLVLGIDPGTIVAGYGVVEANGDSVKMVCSGSIECDKRSSMGERLSYVYAELIKVIEKHKPDEVAIEQPFMAKNAKSALAIGKAQAIAILAAANNGYETHEYPPRQVKMRVTGYGGSTKEQVQEMVRLQLELSEAPATSDAADALAVALCHVLTLHINGLSEYNGF